MAEITFDPIAKLYEIADAADPLGLVTIETGDLMALVIEHRAMQSTSVSDGVVEAVAPFEEIVAEAYKRGWREGCETLIEDYPDAEAPHKDAMGEGCGMFMAEAWPKLRAALSAKERS